jgi:hypothetical protein
LETEAKSDVLLILGIGFIFAAVFLMFREYGFMTVGDEGLLPAVFALAALGVIFFGASVVIRSLGK